MMSLTLNLYIKLDITFLGLLVPKEWFLVVKDPNMLISAKWYAKYPGIISGISYN